MAKKKILFFTVAALLSGVIASCSQLKHQLQQNGIGAYKIPDDYSNLPKMDKTKTLLGIDKNKNGIRDDVEEYINMRMKTDTEKRIALDLARSFQRKLKIIHDSNGDREQLVRQRELENSIVEKHIEELNSSPQEFSLDSYFIFRNIHGITYNTKLRRKAQVALEQCHFNDMYLEYIGK